MHKLLFCLTLLASLNLYASPSDGVATVVKIKGQASKLPPGDIEAINALVDDKISENTMISTGSKSFIKLKFIDNSEISLGPDSKIVILEMTANAPSIISLVDGTIRTIAPGKNQFLIRTRTAVVNAQGSETQLIYNSANRVTSLLTLRGSATMARLDEKTHQRFEKSTTVVERIDNNSAPEIKVIQGKPLLEKEILTKVLTSNYTVTVPQGQTSFTSSELKRSSLPVNIFTAQLNAFFNNREFDKKNIVNIKSGMNLENPKAIITPVEQSAPAGGVKFNLKNGEYAPKSLGLIDINSGLYIVNDGNVGDFDSDTGEYFAPKGLLLDPVQGYLLEKNAEIRPELLALREDLNRNINRDVVVGNPDGGVKATVKTLDEKYIRDRLVLSLKAGNQTLELAPEVGAAPLDLEAKGVLKLSVLWQIATTSRFAPLLGLSFARVGYSALKERNESSDSKSLFSLSGGLKYALTDKIELFSTLVLDQNHYAHQISQSPILYEYKRIVITKLNFGVEGELYKSKKFTLMGEGSANWAFRKKINNQVVSENTGYGVRLTPQYALDEKRSVGLGLYFAIEKAKSTTPSGSSEQSRDDHGVEVKYTVEL